MFGKIWIFGFRNTLYFIFEEEELEVDDEFFIPKSILKHKTDSIVSDSKKKQTKKVRILLKPHKSSQKPSKNITRKK